MGLGCQVWQQVPTEPSHWLQNLYKLNMEAFPFFMLSYSVVIQYMKHIKIKWAAETSRTNWREKENKCLIRENAMLWGLRTVDIPHSLKSSLQIQILISSLALKPLLLYGRKELTDNLMHLRIPVQSIHSNVISICFFGVKMLEQSFVSRVNNRIVIPFIILLKKKNKAQG